MPKHPPKSLVVRFLYENSLSLIVTVFIILSLVGQALTGIKVYNDELEQMGHKALTMGEYLGSGHFIEATFENWESEFLSIVSIVVLSIFLRQQGSPESKPVVVPNSETED